MVDEETVRLVIDLAVLPQLLADRFTFLAGVGEDQAFLSPCMRKDIADARVGGLGRGVGGRFHRRRIHRDRFALVRLRRGVVEMLHTEPPDLFAAVEFRDDRTPAAARREKPPRRLGIANGGGKADAAGIAARQGAQPLDQAEGLKSPIRPQEGVDLVDDDKAQVAEEGRDLHVLVDEQGFQRLGRDLQNAGWLFEQLPLLRLIGVPVPTGDGDALLLAQLVQAPKLVVDERLERGDVQHPHGLGGGFVQQRQNRKKRSLGFARGGGGGEQHVFVRVENGVSRGVLHRPQALPAGAVDVILNKRRVALKYVHIVNSAKAASVSSETASDLA